MTATLTASPVTATSSGATVTTAPAVVVRVVPAPGAERVRALAERAGLRSAADEPAPCATVTVLVAADADQALRAPRPPGPVLFVCDSVAPEDRRRILRAGAVVIGAAELDEESLLRAVHRAAYPHPSIPYPELSGALSTRGRADGPARRRLPSLTARQTSVLRLMAEGHGNADIALLLGCSEHTVKNVIYELMTRLQARNRAHAVAHAVRQGLV
ncbi:MULTISPECIES: LuxR family transcriptional regulator [Streptomyces]|uniref:LuxR family transcriptional regulator n=1 Tax=Streptomyces TaxID=1883 RepID=UPI001E3A3570|nr:response regulator transcription factor [Streptomyces sp. DH20]